MARQLLGHYTEMLGLDQDQARGNPVLPQSTVSKMPSGQGKGLDLGTNGPGHVPDPELGHGTERVTNSSRYKSPYQTLNCTMILHSYSAVSFQIQAKAGIGAPSGAGRRGS